MADIFSLNAGEVSRLALGRVDLAKMRMAMEVQSNLLPKVLGPAYFRPGTAMKTRTRGDAQARLLPFVASISATAEIELTDSHMRVLVDGAPVTRPAVTSAVTNGGFTSDLSGWTSIDETGTSSTWLAGMLVLTGLGQNQAGRRQTVSTSSPNVEHALQVVVTRGPVTFSVGSGAGLDDYVNRTELRTGVHSLAFVPSGSYVIEIKAASTAPKMVDSVTVEAAGVLDLPAPWPTSALRKIRTDQSGDVLFCACAGYQQRRIERRSQRSWSIALYQSDDGPFRAGNTTGAQLSASGVSGSVTLTATQPTFRSGHVGALFRLDVSGQSYVSTLAGPNQFTPAIRVSGVGAARNFDIEVTGTWAGTLTTQRSFGTPGSWQDYAYFSTNLVQTGNDSLDNQIVYYRVGFKTGLYTSGSATVRLSYSGGEQSGIARVTAYTSPTSVEADVVKQISAANSLTQNWAEGSWSDARGWPTSLAFFDGRLWQAMRDMLYGSISDAFESYDANKEGDAGPIQRSIATGGFDSIFWLLPLQRLLAGTAGQEVSIRSSSFDEPLTPTAFTARAASTRGSADVGAIKVDSGGIYVQRNGARVMELRYSVDSQDYQSADLTRLNEDIGKGGVLELAVQREPETRVWGVRADGVPILLTYERADEVVAWTPAPIEGGVVESICVTPQVGGDRVTFVVKRTINGQERRFIETMSQPSECQGGTLSKNLDCHIVYDGASTNTIAGLSHLEGAQVAVWGDGKPIVSGRSPVTVSGGAVTLPVSVSKAVVGLVYRWRLKTSKMPPTLQQKRIASVGIMAADLGWKGVRVGASFDKMKELPNTYRERALASDAVIADYDETVSTFPGGWATDARLCLEGISPYPGTLMGLKLNGAMAGRGENASGPPGNQ